MKKVHPVTFLALRFQRTQLMGYLLFRVLGLDQSQPAPVVPMVVSDVTSSQLPRTINISSCSKTSPRAPAAADAAAARWQHSAAAAQCRTAGCLVCLKKVDYTTHECISTGHIILLDYCRHA